MDIGQIIAENLKRLRTERNLSLGQLSKCCDISKVMLSQIEKNKTNPTINTLWKIAGGLKVPYTALLEKKEHHTQVIKKSETKIQAAENGQYRLYCYYSSTPERNFELFQLEIDAGCRYTSIGHLEKSEEYIMVLEGSLWIYLKDECFQLDQNETIRFTASDSHCYENKGETRLKAIVINFYPG